MNTSVSMSAKMRKSDDKDEFMIRKRSAEVFKDSLRLIEEMSKEIPSYKTFNFNYGQDPQQQQILLPFLKNTIIKFSNRKVDPAIIESNLIRIDPESDYQELEKIKSEGFPSRSSGESNLLTNNDLQDWNINLAEHSIHGSSCNSDSLEEEHKKLSLIKIEKQKISKIKQKLPNPLYLDESDESQLLSDYNNISSSSPARDSQPEVCFQRLEQEKGDECEEQEIKMMEEQKLDFQEEFTLPKILQEHYHLPLSQIEEQLSFSKEHNLSYEEQLPENDRYYQDQFDSINISQLPQEKERQNTEKNNNQTLSLYNQEMKFLHIENIELKEMLQIEMNEKQKLREELEKMEKQFRENRYSRTEFQRKICEQRLNSLKLEGKMQVLINERNTNLFRCEELEEQMREKERALENRDKEKQQLMAFIENLKAEKTKYWEKEEELERTVREMREREEDLRNSFWIIVDDLEEIYGKLSELRPILLNFQKFKGETMIQNEQKNEIIGKQMEVIELLEYKKLLQKILQIPKTTRQNPERSSQIKNKLQMNNTAQLQIMEKLHKEQKEQIWKEFQNTLESEYAQREHKYCQFQNQIFELNEMNRESQNQLKEEREKVEKLEGINFILKDLVQKYVDQNSFKTLKDGVNSWRKSKINNSFMHLGSREITADDTKQKERGHSISKNNISVTEKIKICLQNADKKKNKQNKQNMQNKQQKNLKMDESGQIVQNLELSIDSTISLNKTNEKGQKNIQKLRNCSAPRLYNSRASPRKSLSSGQNYPGNGKLMKF